MIAQNKMLVANTKADSASIADMEQGRIALEKAINECQTALSKDEVISADRQALLSIANQALKELKGEIRKQKFLKWLGFTWAALATIVAVALSLK